MKKLIATLTEILSRNVDFVVKTVTIGGTVLAMLSVILYLQSDIEKKINEKLSDPKFVKQIAAEIKSPSIIFLSDGNAIHDDGGSEFVYLDKIVPEYDDKKMRVVGITITTKQFMKNPPILSSIDGEEYFQEAKRVDTFKWEYKTIELDRVYWSLPNDKMPLGRYKLEIVR
ncbi:MAG: hypothetical protein HY885_13430 [Deltaproteobacteria bacterium]|nr:hypothetical protein [Deltaproteobacteria bacterium]